MERPNGCRVLAGLLVLALASGFAVVVPAAGATTTPTLYVASSGSDSGNSCTTQASPCATVSHALSEAAAGDTIQVSGTIDDHVDATIPVTITGAGASSPAVIDGGANGAVVQVASGTTVSISNLTITNGKVSGLFAAGGGLVNKGTTALNDVTVSDSSASFFAGGILNDPGSTMTVADSTISGNTASNGSGIENQGGTMTITDSTISGNGTSAGGGGGILNASGSSDTGTVTVLASTIADNQAAAGDGGGIDVGSAPTSTTLGATIVADNTGGNCVATTAPVSLGYNLTDDAGTDCGFTQATDLVNTDPDLASLADNGGPTETQLPAIASPALGVVPVGTTLDGTSVCPGTDQRGIARPQPSGANACAIGAVEEAPATEPTFTSPAGTTFTVGTSSSFTVATAGSPTPTLSESGSLPIGVTFSANDDGTATLVGTPAAGSRGTYPIALTATNAKGSVTQNFTLYVAQALQTFYVAAGGLDSGNCQRAANPCASVAYALSQAGPGDTIDLSGTVPGVTALIEPITLTGAPAGVPAVLNGEGNGPVLTVPVGVEATIEDVTVTGGATSSGAGLDNEGTTTVTNTTFSDNTASGAGGAIANSGTLAVATSTFSANTATMGAAIDNAGSLSLSAATLADNQGAAIESDGTSTTLASTILADNTGGNCAGMTTPVSLGYNLTDDAGTDCGLTQATDLVNADPDLARLADNGGPTETQAPASSSPALGMIPTGTAGCPGTDQRGVARPEPSGGSCAIGAVEPAPSTTTLRASPAQGAQVGQSVTLTATVTSDLQNLTLPTPAGTVAFGTNGGPIAGCSSVAVSSGGTATCTTTALPQGTNALSAAYAGVNGYLASTGALPYSVGSATVTSTTLSSSANPSAPGNVTFTATVKAASGGGTPSGTVAFIVDGGSYKPCAAVTVHSGKATCTASFKASTTHSVRAAYGGDGSYSPSSSATLTQKVSDAPATHATLSAGETLAANQSLTAGSYRLTMQGDGNLVEYQGSKARWSTSTQGHPGAGAVMQKNGNVVIYLQGKALWATTTQGHPGAHLVLQSSDGNIVVYGPNGKALWASGT